jgi:hypothetical protein
MKGIVFDLLERATIDAHGENAWDDLLEAADLDGSYTSLGSYPDAQFVRLVDAAAERFGMPQQEVIRWLGRTSIPHLADSYPGFFEPHRTTRDFVLTLNQIIHPEVRKLYPGALVPDFAMSTMPDGSLVMGYGSPRRMCAFAEGLIEGAAAHYGEHVTITQPRCMHRGDETCELDVVFD